MDVPQALFFYGRPAGSHMENFECQLFCQEKWLVQEQLTFQGSKGSNLLKKRYNLQLNIGLIVVVSHQCP